MHSVEIAAPVANVKSALTAAGVQDTVRILDTKVPTAAAAAEALSCDVAAITNSLIFDVDGAPLLILASGAAKVDTKLVAARLGTGKIRRATPTFVLQHTGQQVGGVAPIGHPEKIRTLLDGSLKAHKLL
jgi:prolyl-tRNA editing enzyme YbaK/EbsC (Cys-tRNA(Pro) deacylase)